jgi:hypothetical protein
LRAIERPRPAADFIDTSHVWFDQRAEVVIDVSRILDLVRRSSPPDAVIPEGASEEECDAFEQRTGIDLPQDVRSWLMLSNGPLVGPGGLYGIRTPKSFLDIESQLHSYPQWKTEKWVPVAGDGCGNYYLVNTQGEFGEGHPVFFIDTIASKDLPSHIVASDIGHFLIGILEQELDSQNRHELAGLSHAELCAGGSPLEQFTGRWPFDEHSTIEFDPHILDFPGLTLPWMTD